MATAPKSNEIESPHSDDPATGVTKATNESQSDRPNSVSEDIPVALSPPIKAALEKVSDQETRRVLSVALSRTTFGFGPDPETAKILSEAEIHEEECKLKAFQSSLQNREKQGQRDHEFRKKKLNHQTALTVSLLVFTIAAVGGGLMLSATGNSALGNPVLVAGLTLLSTLAGKLLSGRDKE